MPSADFDLAAVAVSVEEDPEGGFTAFNDELRCMAAGRTAAQATKHFQSALAALIDYCEAKQLVLGAPLEAARR